MPSDNAGGEAPDAEPCKEVDLREAFEVGGLDKFNAPIIDHAIGDQAVFDEFAQGSGGERVKFVVIGRHSGPIEKRLWIGGQLRRWRSRAARLSRWMRWSLCRSRNSAMCASCDPMNVRSLAQPVSW